MKIIATGIRFGNHVINPPPSDDLIDHLKWVFYVTDCFSKEGKFSHSLLSYWARSASLSEKQQDAGRNMVARVRDAFEEAGYDI